LSRIRVEEKTSGKRRSDDYANNWGESGWAVRNCGKREFEKKTLRNH